MVILLKIPGPWKKGGGEGNGKSLPYCCQKNDLPSSTLTSKLSQPDHEAQEEPSQRLQPEHPKSCEFTLKELKSRMSALTRLQVALVIRWATFPLVKPVWWASKPERSWTIAANRIWHL